MLLYLERKGKSPRSIDAYKRSMKQIAKRVKNLDNTEEVELAIARYTLLEPITHKKTNQPASGSYKAKLCDAYQHYCKFNRVVWEKPIYKEEEHGIQPPTDAQCAMLIASARGALSLRIDISTQTGLRPVEVQGYKGLKVKDIHTEQRTITALSTKGCNARPPMQISEELNTKLKTYITKKNLKAEDYLFSGDAARYGEHFRRFRNKLSEKLKDPSIKGIRLYDLRHYYVTKLLRKIQNAEFVRQIVGHKRLNTTQRYMHLLANTNGEWIVEGTKGTERAKQLLEADFIYQLTTQDGTMIFKKAK